MAVLEACKQLNERLKPYKEAHPNEDFKSWVNKAWFDRVNLSAHAFWKVIPVLYSSDLYQVPVGSYNFETGEGEPFCYFTCGVAASEVIIDTLTGMSSDTTRINKITGDHRVLSTEIIFDMGDSINPTIDIGQIEGAFVQGVGWHTTEEMGM